MPTNTPLTCEVKDGELVVRIGISTLAEASEFEGRDPFWVFDYDQNKFVQEYKIIAPVGWAKDVCREINREGEDGSSLLTHLLDTASERALDQGSLSVWSPKWGN
jgi:hypothetical protein